MISLFVADVRCRLFEGMRHSWFVFIFPGVFFLSVVTEACPVTHELDYGGNE